MKKKNLQGGFIPFLVIAIIAILAIGAGVYVAKKNREAGAPQANQNAQENANANANLGVNANINAKTNVSLRSLLSLGQNTMCTFSKTSSDTTSSGTVYFASDGEMHGMFQTRSGTKSTVTSHMIIKGGVTYAWTGTQGVKMDFSQMNVGTSAEVQARKYADLDAQGDYECSPWVRDDSQFNLPAGVNFMDLNALLKLNTGIKTTIPGY